MRSNQTTRTNQFSGLNRRPKAAAGELETAYNLTTDAYPCLSVRKPRKKIPIGNIKNIAAFIAPRPDSEDIGGFTGVADGKFYYRGEVVPKKDTAMEPLSEEAVLADFNGKIIIAPLMYYYDTTLSQEDENYHVLFRLSKGVFTPTAMSVTSTEGKNGAMTNKITCSSLEWEDYFRSGDNVRIEGFTGDAQINNTKTIDSRFSTAEKGRPISVIIDKIDGHTLYVRMYDKNFQETGFYKNASTLASGLSANLKIHTDIPTMNSICVHNNRLWGTNPNGEFIYASKPGNPACFNTFEGLSTDSWYCEIGTKGAFCGIIPFRDNIVAFKNEYIHHVYGDKPTNYAVPKQLEYCGCRDIKSAVQIGIGLYYLGNQGFYLYTGGQPVLISEKLGYRYLSATAVTDGVKYYAEAVREDGVREFLCYDPARNLWLTETAFGLTGGGIYNGRLYCTGTDTMYEFGTGEERVAFCAVTAPITENTSDLKGVNEFFVRVSIDGGQIEIATASGNGPFVTHCQRSTDGLYNFYIPVRFRGNDTVKIRIRGDGNVTLYDMERRIFQGGRNLLS